MPTLLTTPSVSLLESCEAAHRAHGYDFPRVFDDFFTNHYVFKGPDYLLLGRADPDDPDAWLVWWAECRPARSRAEMLRLFLRHMPHYRERVGWWRPLKNTCGFKYYSTRRLLRFIEAKAGDQ